MMHKIKLSFILIFLLSAPLTHSKEGMWLPMLIERLNIEDMKTQGFKLEAKDIYDINNACMKDAVMLFGRGCTAELISDKGLILTNHHCGFKQIQSHSTLENDYITRGFWAMNKKEELSNPGLTVTFLRFMQDVTQDVLKGVDETMPEHERKLIVQANIDSIQKSHAGDEYVKVSVSAFYSGNQYVLFVSDVFKDVRLVGAPPAAIGKFGGDTDNWMWPRHGGDFSLFRIYANKDNKPSGYSDDNVPYKPKYVFPVSLNGIDEGDFTMVFGYPGSTYQYASSAQLKSMRDYSYPKLIKIRDTKLKIIDQAMDADPEVRIKYAAKAASISNAWKRWIGELKGYERFDVINKKEESEKAFMAWIQARGKTRHENLFAEYEALYSKQAELNLAANITSEIMLKNGIEVLTLAEKTDHHAFSTDSLKEAFQNEILTISKDYDRDTDLKIAEHLTRLYFEYMPPLYQSQKLRKLYLKSKEDPAKAMKKLFKTSIYNDFDKLSTITREANEKHLRKLKKDPAYVIASDLGTIYYKTIRPALSGINAQIDSLDRVYIKLLAEYDSTITAYPDANLTLRLTYGKVAAYAPRDAVKYDFSTTLDGIMEKDNPNIYDYRVPERLKELHKQKDYGIYARPDGKLPVCFIGTNHTTGGNSGSPVINAKGHLVGLNFDRAWEGVMSDFYYNPEICRNISVDIRYVLFIIDKFAGAGYLMDEMHLVSE